MGNCKSCSGNCNGQCGGCGNECNKSSNWWGNEFGFNPSGYSDAPVVQQNWWNEQFSPRMVGVGAVNEIAVCTDTAIEKAKNSGDYQRLLDAGYTDEQITDAIWAECAKQLEDDSKEHTALGKPVTVKTGTVIAVVAGTAIVSGIVGVLIGKNL